MLPGEAADAFPGREDVSARLEGWGAVKTRIHTVRRRRMLRIRFAFMMDGRLLSILNFI
jgi:hypothetical protein